MSAIKNQQSHENECDGKEGIKVPFSQKFQKCRYIAAVLNNCFTCRLGLFDRERKVPYIVPMTFTYELSKKNDGYPVVYFHWLNQKQGCPNQMDTPNKMDCINNYHNKDPKEKIDVCIEFDVTGPFIPPDKDREEEIGCLWDTAYSSVIAYGKLEKVTDEKEKVKALEQRLKRFAQRELDKGFKEIIDMVAIWKVALDKNKTMAKYRLTQFTAAPDDK